MKSIILAIIGAVVLVGGIVVATWLLRPEEMPDPKTQDEPAVVRYMASERFERLDEAKRKAYFDSVSARFEDPRTWRNFDADLSDAEQERMRKNVGPLFRGMMFERLDRYFELSSAEQVAEMDRIIDQMQLMRAEGERRRRPGGFGPDQLKQLIEKTPPETRAKVVVFIAAMGARMKARGIQPRRPGG